ncbi:DUF2167 domain-containing protein [Nevskia sp.]|uniref:DUF2167 domain-containing protein n=1 Tax=Nevskia sp. TaxID=1929292 RepID=UPI0025F5A7ED|nr:DUF2167 domain-containing protein [Nevskia sp.]
MNGTMLARVFGLMLLAMTPLAVVDAQERDRLAEAQAEAGVDTTANAVDAAWAIAGAALQRGPQDVRLRDQGLLKLPGGYGFVPLEEARKLMEALGNSVDKRFVGLIFPVGQPDANWMMTLDFDPAGYIRDDDAREWNADDMLKSLREGTLAGNERRRALGYPGLEVTQWIEPPNWDAANQRLVWSLEARDIGAEVGAPGTVNYNTYVLGREGYFEMNLITSSAEIERYKPDARSLLAAVAFDEGKRYADFKPDTDKVATYGLAALVGGVAAKKLGLLAVIGVFLAKFAKVIILAVAGFGALAAKFVRGKKS